MRPNGRIVTAKDYRHKVTTIDIQIELQKWIRRRKAEVLSYHRYFDKEGSNRKVRRMTSVNKVSFQNSFIIPDSTMLAKEGGFERLYLIELHYGKDSKRIYNQINAHLQLLLSFRAHIKYDYPKDRAYFILIAFSEETTLHNSINRFKEQQAKYYDVDQFILCKSLTSINETNIEDEWLSILGNPHSLSIKSN